MDSRAAVEVSSHMARKKVVAAPQPEENEDEFALAMQEGVEDDSTNDTENIVRFNISSYGADYTVDSLVKRLQTGAFFVPPFQRAYVWNQNQASRFIESLLLGLPVPGIFLYKEPATNKHLIVDGQQRLKTIQFFYDGTFLEKRFRLTNVSKQWAGKTYDDLEEPDRQKLEDSIVHATIFQQDERLSTERTESPRGLARDLRRRKQTAERSGIDPTFFRVSLFGHQIRTSDERFPKQLYDDAP
jgi:hypothetical protein